MLAYTALVPVGAVLMSGIAMANPLNGKVVAGNVNIGASGSTLTVTQTSNRAIINWNSFSIANGETAKFSLPSSTAAVLNRVTGDQLSSLLGNLYSNGQVYLLNPNGIVIGPNGRVNTAGFIASTLDTSDQQFMQGGAVMLEGSSTAGVVVLGSVKANDGDVLLVAAQVDNQGKLLAPNGQAILAAGSEVLYVPGDYVNIAVAAPAPASGAAVSNTGLIKAASAQLAAAGTPYQLAVNNGGQISATAVGTVGGHVMLQAGDGDITDSGAIRAKAGSTGGTVAMTGGRIAITGAASVTVSAPSGGGSITLAATNAISVASGTSLKANATTKGNGGTISVKAATATQFAGTASAKGGPNGGNGGQAEISGGNLLYSGSVNLSAPAGTTGTLLFDPDEITIVSGDAAAPSAIGGGLWSFTQNSGAQTISVGAIETLLASANLQLQATTSLTVATPGTGAYATISSNTANTLTFTSPTIAINAPISLPNGTLVLGWPASAVGSYGYPQSLTSSSNATITAHALQIAADFPTLTLSGAVVTPSLQFTVPTSQMDVTIANPANAIQAVSFDPANSGNAAASVDIETSSAMTVSGNIQISFTGILLAGGDLTLASGTSLQGGPTLNLVSTGGVLNNLAGPNAVVTGNGQVLIYSATNGTSASGTAFNDGGIGAAARLAQNYGTASGVTYPSNPNTIDTVVEYFVTTSVEPVLNITANSFQRNYGQPDPTFTASYSGGSGGGATELTMLPSFRIVQGSDINAGTYTIQPYGAASSVDLLSYTDGLLTVNPVPLTVTANNAMMTYGGTAPTLTYGVSGLVNGDSSSIVSGVQFSPAPTSTTSAGSYTLAPLGGTVAIPLGGTQPNYTLTYQSGSLTVNPAPLAVSAVAESTNYGSAIPTLPLQFAGFVNQADASSVPAQFVPLVSAVQGSAAGTYAITLATLNPNPNYSVTYTGANLTINPVLLTITPNISSTYGGAVPSVLPAADYAGFVNGDTSGSLTTPPMVHTTGTSSSPAGTYSVTASGAADPNYTIQYDPGTLTINPASLTIRPNLTKTYGAAAPSVLPAADFVGLVNGDTPASLTTQPGISTAATASSGVGSYSVTASGAVDANYTISYAPGVLTVNPAPLLITVNSASRLYGASNPSFSAAFSGLVNNDASTVVSGLNLGTTATTSSNVGTYAITASGAAAANYSISYAPGTLTVNPAPLLITVNDASRLYGDINPTFTASYSGLVNNDPSTVVAGLTLGTAATAASNVGTYAITGSGGRAANYTITYAPGTLTVNPAMLYVTPSGSQVYYGTPTVTYSYSGFALGDTPASLTSQPTYSTTATQSSSVGSYPLSASGASALNYTIINEPGVFQVLPAPLTVTANSYTINPTQSVPSLTGTFNSFVGPDTQTSTGYGFHVSVPSTVGIATVSSAGLVAGTYMITLTGSDPNYSVTYVPGTVTVNAATVSPASTNLTLSPITTNTNTNTNTLNTNITSTNLTVTVNPTPNQVTVSAATLASFGFSFTQGEGVNIVQDFVNDMNAGGGDVTVAEVDAELSDPSTASQTQALLIPYMMADLGNILKTPQSSWTTAQQVFVLEVTGFIQAQQQAAAIQAEDAYAAWYKQTTDAEIQELNSLPGTARSEMQEIMSSNPPVPPSSILQQVETGLSMTGSQLASLANIQTTTNTLATLASDPSALAKYTGGAASGVGRGVAWVGKVAQVLAGAPGVASTSIIDAIPALKSVFPAAYKGIVKAASEGQDLVAIVEEAGSIAGDMGSALEIGGLAAEVVGNMVQIGIAVAGYVQINQFNSAFNNAVAAANQPVTVSSLQSMLSSTSGTSQLYTYMEAMVATGGTTPTVYPPGIPASVYESQTL